MSVINYNFQKEKFENLKRSREEDDFTESSKRYKIYHKEITENDLEINEEYLADVFETTLKINAKKQEDELKPKEDEEWLYEWLSEIKIKETEEEEIEILCDDISEIIEFQEEEEQREQQEEYREQKEKILHIELMNL